MKNLEIKARCGDHKKLVARLRKLGAKKKEVMHQVDTYFVVPQGRLKLRELGPKNAYLIYYERGEKATRRWSNYYTYDVTNQHEFKKFWSKTLGVKVIVDKRRVLYMYQNARIHVDTVRGLGLFMEIEVEVKKGNVQARRLMGEILVRLEISKKDFIKGSYSDMLS